MKRSIFILAVVSIFLFGCNLVTPQSAEGPTVIPQASAPTLESSPTPEASPTFPPPSETPTQAPTALPSPTTISVSQPVTITAIQMSNPSDGWGIGQIDGSYDRVLKTGDGGTTWREVTPAGAVPTGTELKTALGSFQNADRAWVIYSSPPGTTLGAEMIWRTQDGGKTWQSSQPLDMSGLDENFAPSHLQFIDTQHGWMLSHVGVGMNHDYVALYESTDGGASWARLLDPYNDGGIQSCSKNAMLFTDSQHGWLTGSCNGVAEGVLLFRSSDAGHTWQSVTLPEPESSPTLFTTLGVECGSEYPAFLTPQQGYLAVRCNHYDQDPAVTITFLYATVDGGDHWTSTKYPGGSLLFFNAQEGLALGKDLYKTQDGGKNWTKFSVVSWDGQFDFLTGELGWAVARAGDQVGLVLSQNGGQTWKLVKPMLVH
jgi:photosystem II stability/assembly factor-like uncharacterized protein